jgi:patatin-related protein
MHMAEEQPKERGREVRLGLVMYGGVSLAIYINGIANELFRAVRGRGVYGLLKAITDSDVVVDVLSGSSAGGINGILLSYALCNGCEFGGTAQLWRDHGDIGDLMRDTNGPRETYLSVLDSEGKYEPALRMAFEKMDAARIKVADPDRSKFQELDLFVTGTDFYGRTFTTLDDRGQKIQVKDHRTAFWLKHREGRKCPFSPNADAEDTLPEPGKPGGNGKTWDALARLARITSCFPGAFAPVSMKYDGIDLRLRRWAALPLNDAQDRVFIDGGVLDNKPFSTTLEAIYSRLSDRPVSRWLLYVEPDPERFEAKAATVPDVVKTAIASITSLPAYESIADDLRSLREHNESIERMVSIERSLLNGGLPAGAGDGQYERLRVVRLMEHVFSALFTQDLNRGGDDPDRRDARSALRTWFTTYVLGPIHAELPPASTRADAAAPEEDIHRLLERFDMDFRLRRLYHLAYRHDNYLWRHRPLSRALNRHIELLEMIRAALERAVERVMEKGQLLKRPDRGYDELWAQGIWIRVLAALNSVIGDAELQRFAEENLSGMPAPGMFEENVKAFGEHLRVAQEAAFERTPGTADWKPADLGLLEILDAMEAKLFEGELLQPYRMFERLDRLLFPIQLISGVHQQDVIRVARVSPIDSRQGLSNSDEKVIGRLFGHFAAFFKRSWRSNDILWGRLDGAGEIVDVLLRDTVHLREAFADGVAARALAELHTWISGIEEGTNSLALLEPERTVVMDWLHELASHDARRRMGAIDRLERERGEGGICCLLIKAVQLEALYEDLPKVLGDAAAEQLEWNQYAPPEKPVEGRTTVQQMEKIALERSFIAGTDHLDPGVISAVTEGISRSVVDKLKTDPKSTLEFFTQRYAIGRETLANIPPTILFDYAARALVLARNALLASLRPRDADRVEGSPVYQIFLAWPLRANAALAATLRRSPASTSAFIVGAVVYIALSLVVIALWWSKVIVDEHKLSVPGGVLFLGIPLALVVALRAIVASADGSHRFVRWLRSFGWVLGLVVCLLLFPAAFTLLNVSSKAYCEAAYGAVPGLNLLCHPDLVTLYQAGRWAAVVAILLGVAWIGGLFGAIQRRMRAKFALRVQPERERPRPTGQTAPGNTAAPRSSS